jgi:hypothetical protein
MTVRIRSNVAELNRTLSRLPDALDLDAGQLGDRLANALAPRIKDRFDAQRGAEGRFAKNRGKYGKRKRKRGIPVGVGLHDGGEMARLANFLGRRTVKKEEAEIAFGITNFARRKGMWFENGNQEGEDGTEASAADGQPPRPFFEMTDADVDVLADVCAARIIEHLRGL